MPLRAFSSPLTATNPRVPFRGFLSSDAHPRIRARACRGGESQPADRPLTRADEWADAHPMGRAGRAPATLGMPIPPYGARQRKIVAKFHRYDRHATEPNR
jgi:hypothetical protein